MAWRERWERGDPAKVLERKQEQRGRTRRGALTIDPFGALWAKGKMVMTNDESMQVEDLLMAWYRYEVRWRPDLGGGRASSYCKNCISEPGPDDTVDTLDRIEALAVAKCLDALSWQQRGAVGVHCANKAAGNALMRNPRLTVEEAHQQYQQAKADLLPMLRAEGLVSAPPAPAVETVAAAQRPARVDVGHLARLERLVRGPLTAERRPTITMRGLLKKCLQSA